MRRSTSRKPGESFKGRGMGSAGALAMGVLMGAVVPAWSDDFGRLEGSRLFELPDRGDARKRSAVGLRDLEALPAVLHDERAAFVLVKTDLGNLAKLLVSSGLRKLKPSEEESPLVPVLVLERFETIDGGDRRSLKARGKDVMLFDGFQFDLDTGCVVPDGLGGDILFSARGPDGPRLAAVGHDRLFTLAKPIPPAEAAAGQPSSGRAVRPADFVGRYYLMANGQWSGTLELAVDAAGAVTGHFRSDKNGASYGVSGAVSPDVSHKIDFSIQFPRAKQVYEGLLWTEGKNAIAGTVSMLERQYGFVAMREGSSLAPESVDLGPRAAASPGTQYRIVVVEAGSDRYRLDGNAQSAAELTDALLSAVKANPAIKVLLRAPESASLERVLQAARLIEQTGVRSIRLGNSADAHQAE
jgi:biopolymer transport protein ExbD